MDKVKSLADLEILCMQLEGCGIPGNVELHIKDKDLYEDIMKYNFSKLHEVGLSPTIEYKKVGVKFVIKK